MRQNQPEIGQSLLNLNTFVRISEDKHIPPFTAIHRKPQDVPLETRKNALAVCATTRASLPECGEYL